MKSNWIPRVLLRLGIALGLLMGGTTSALAATPQLAELPALRPVIDCAALVGVNLGDKVGAKVMVQSATLYPGAKPFCCVRGTIAPSIGFAVKLPTEGWTQRYLQVGCGGLCGSVALRIDHASDCMPVARGATVIASTDMGHREVVRQIWPGC